MRHRVRHHPSCSANCLHGPHGASVLRSTKALSKSGVDRPSSKTPSSPWPETDRAETLPSAAGYADGPGGRHASPGGGEGGWLCSRRPLLRCRSRRYLQDLFQHARGRKRLAFWKKGAHIRSGHDDPCLVVVEVARNLAFPTALTGLQPRALDLLLAATRASASHGFRVR